MKKVSVEISKVLGASLTSSKSVDVVDDIVAYTASGGVVVAQFDGTSSSNTKNSAKNSTIKSQRFFHPNARESSSTKSSDSFGYPKSMVCSDLPESESSSRNSSLSMKSKVRSVTSVAISPNKRLLAVGESGYMPRVLIYSLAPDSSDHPLVLLSEHSFGINCLRFSPNSECLASLGNTNDGYLHVWKLQGHGTHFNVSIVASNKCNASVTNMVWLSSGLMTYGLRHFRVWQLGDDRVIRGKNILMRELLNELFIDVGFVTVSSASTAAACDSLHSPKKAGCDSGDSICTHSYDTLPLVLTRSGHIAKIVNNSLVLLTKLTWSPECFLIDEECDSIFLELAGGSPIQIKLSSLLASNLTERESLLPRSAGALISFHKNSTHYFSVANNNQIMSFHKETYTQSEVTVPLLPRISGSCKLNDGLLVWSEYGEFAIVNSHYEVQKIGNFELFPGEDGLDNRLTAMIVTSSNHAVFCDRFGFLFIQDLQSKEFVFSTKIHESTINDIEIFVVEDITFLVTVSRDRTIQILYSNEPTVWSILQTLTVHKSNVIQVLHQNNSIITSATDKSIAIHTVIVTKGVSRVKSKKVIVTKSMPVKMGLANQELVISTNDKLLSVYSLETAELKRSFKVCDDFTGSSLLVDHLAVFPQLDILICSCSDKSIRSVSYSSGKILSVSWAHDGVVVGLFSGSGPTFTTSAIPSTSAASTTAHKAKPSSTSTPSLASVFSPAALSSASYASSPPPMVEETFVSSISVDGCIFRWKASIQTSTPSTPLHKVQRKVARSQSISNLKSRSLPSSPLPKVRVRSVHIRQSVVGKTSDNGDAVDELVTALRKFKKVYDGNSNKEKFEVLRGELKALGSIIELGEPKPQNAVKNVESLKHEKKNEVQKEKHDAKFDDTSKLLEHYSDELVKLVKAKLN